MMAKKAKRTQYMKFFNLRLNEMDIDHLRWVLENEAESQQWLMDSPPTKGSSPEQALEDWIVARDLKAEALKIIQLIDRVRRKTDAK